MSTNRIARALGMSTGTLYYHFRNKEEIIRVLFERLSSDLDSVYVPPARRAPDLTDLDGVLRGHLQTLWHYRFIYREIAALAQRDPELRTQYCRQSTRGHKYLVELINALIREGVLRKPEGQGAVTELAHAWRVVAEFWLPFMELARAHMGGRALDEGVGMLHRVIRPHLRRVDP